MKAKPQKILTRSGQVLVEGTAPTLKAFVEGIVREGGPLQGLISPTGISPDSTWMEPTSTGLIWKTPICEAPR